MTKRIDLTGQTFGNLFVEKFSHTNKPNNMSYYCCVCICGAIRLVSHGNLRTGHTRSCGCLPNIGNTKHGKTRSKAYTSWRKIKERCFNPSDTSYANYGAKGVTMSEEYAESFPAFFLEVGEPLDSRCTIDRVDNSRGYEQGNMRWATKAQQARNTSKRVTNTSGTTGVQFYFSGIPTHTTYVVATWHCIHTGKLQNKKFSIKKYGLLPAFKMAWEYRHMKISELNTKCAGYSPNHGK